MRVIDGANAAAGRLLDVARDDQINQMKEILERQLGQFDRAGPHYGRGVRAALKARGRNLD